MMFSQRYVRAIADGRVAVDLPEGVRQKLWMRLRDCNSSLYIQNDPTTDFSYSSSALEEAGSEFQLEMGWETLPGQQSGSVDSVTALGRYFAQAEGPHIFDIIELAYAQMEIDSQDKLKKKTNEIFDLAGCPWRLSDGQFFKLDVDFIGARLAEQGHGSLAKHNFQGATDEYGKALQALASGDTREAIFYAGHSFESVMKTLTGLEHANADALIKALAGAGWFDDIPESIRTGFTANVLYSLPLLRNKLGGHGQGPKVIVVSQEYGDLAVQLAATLNNFLISKHLQRSPPAPPAPPPAPPRTSFSVDDELPF